ncbi:hypothetical protein RIF29_19491 [Crotalaria pallida]|uniref:Uncharacterized protein n=1 Tax=Crotalaria pallida TaxID=3830 RepID=A0AAN9EZL4_CROPI
MSMMTSSSTEFLIPPHYDVRSGIIAILSHSDCSASFPSSCFPCYPLTCFLMPRMKNATVNNNEDSDGMPLREYMTMSGRRRRAERRMEHGEPSQVAPDRSSSSSSQGEGEGEAEGKGKGKGKRTG